MIKGILQSHKKLRWAEMALERRDRSRKQNKGPETEPSTCVTVQHISAISKQQEKDDVSNSGAEKM